MTPGEHLAVQLTLIEWVLTLIAILAFVTLYAWRSDWRSTSMGKNILAFTAVSGIEIACLLLIGFGVPVPVVVFPVVFGAATITVWWRLWLLLQAQRIERKER